MSLTYNRFTGVTLIALLIVALSLVAWLFVVEVKPVQAGTCGTNLLYDYYCKFRCTHTGYCDNGQPRVVCENLLVEKLTNPYSDRPLYPVGDVTYCQWVSPNCPTFCA